MLTTNPPADLARSDAEAEARRSFAEKMTGHLNEASRLVKFLPKDQRDAAIESLHAIWNMVLALSDRHDAYQLALAQAQALIETQSVEIELLTEQRDAVLDELSTFVNFVNRVKSSMWEALGEIERGP